MAPPYTAAHLAEALSAAFRRVLRQQPRQTLPTEVIIDGITLFFGGLLCDMIRQSQLTPKHRQDFLEVIGRNLRLAVDAADQQRAQGR